jgi:hypothetical protein
MAAMPDVLGTALAEDPTKQQQWNAFIQDVAIDPGPPVDVLKVA